MTARVSMMVVFIAATTLFAGGCASRRPADTIRASGEHRFKYGDYAGARDEYAEIVSYYPGNWEDQYMLGLSMLKTGQRDQLSGARRALDTAYTLKPENQDVANALADAMFQQGDEGRLFAFLRERASTTQTVPAYLALAHYCAEMNDPDSAQTALDTAIQIDNGKGVEPYYQAALLAERLGHLDDAVRRLRQAYGINPQDRRVQQRLIALGEQPGAVSPLPPGR